MPASAFLTSRSHRSQSILTLSSTACSGRRGTTTFFFPLSLDLGRPLIAPRKPSSCLMAPPMGECGKVFKRWESWFLVGVGEHSLTSCESLL
jgi:hypothetical protein